MNLTTPGEISGLKRFQKGRLALVGLAGAFVLIDVFLLAQGRNLRPGSDDYCLAADAYRGLIGEVLFWWDTTSGYLYSGFLGSLLVGLPGLHLPLSLGSLISFAVTSLLVGLTVLYLVRYKVDLIFKQPSTRIIWSVLIVAAGLAAWWSFLWWPHEVDDGSRSALFALGLTHWQTINSVYIVQSLTLLVGGLLSWRLLRNRRNLSIALAAMIGILSGFAGPVTTLTIVLTVAAMATYWVLFDGRRIKPNLSWILVLIGTSVASALIAHSAPGTQSRVEVVGGGGDLTVTDIGEILNHTVPGFITEWLGAFAHIGSLAVILIFVPIGWLTSRCGLMTYSVLPAQFGLALAGIGLLFSFSALLGEQFAYEGYWHFAPVRLFAFLALVLWSVGAGLALAEIRWTFIRALMVSSMILGLLVASGTAMAMATNIAARQVQWESGGATVKNGTVADIDSFSWVSECWERLRDQRELPARGSQE